MKRVQPDDGYVTDTPDRYTYEEAEELDEEIFERGGIDRRTFLSVAAATGAALALPSTVSAEVTDDRVTDLAQFAISATPDDYEVTVVIEFADVTAVQEFYGEFGEPDWDIDENLRAPKAVYREEPTPAAHAWLTEAEVQYALDEMTGIEHVDFSPGAHPFWNLEDSYGDYDVYPEYIEEFDVFPPVEGARDWTSHQETGQALDHLETTYPDMVNVERIGQGPGWENVFTGEDPDPRDIYVAELTNDVQDREAFAAKEKCVFIVGIHGNERAGVEAGSRIIEQAAKGEAEEFNTLLDDIAIIYVYINPDGWSLREPQYYGPNILFHYRGNASLVDTNRQYPTIGWANPGFWPADAGRAPDPRPGYDVGYQDVVPDALATVGHLRGYDNVEYLCDYHMMGWASQMVLNLESNAAYNHDGTHNLDEVNRRITSSMDDYWGGPAAIADDTIRAGADTAGLSNYVPDTLIDYGSIYDSLGYNITGGLLGWAGQPEAFGGLGAITVAPELAMRDSTDWRPYIERHLETAYYLSQLEFARLCAADTDATVATGDQDTAYVTTDALTRRSADLSHTDESPGKGRGRGQERATEVQRRHETVHPGPEGSARKTTGGGSHSIAVQFDAGSAEEGVVSLRNPGGQVVRAIDLAESDQTSFYVPNPGNGDWSVEFDGEADIEVEFVTIESDEEHPNPEEAFGYPQTEYVVNPMQFFLDLEPQLESGKMDGLRVHDVRVGRLMRGNSGRRRYDKVVISHDEGRDDEQYIAEIEAFVDAGGDLVLTDTGLYLLDSLSVGETEAISVDDIQTVEVGIANLVDRDFDHYLLSDIRPLQREMWKSPQVGYVPNTNDQPATILDDDAFAAAGGAAAGRMQVIEGPWRDEEIVAEGVAAGSLSAGDAEINLLGSVLPPANQRELHPFGMADYAVSFMGHTMLCNALGFQQRRFVEGELVGTWGEVR
ncbi:M14 family zinc carboxypeptidase [Haloarchaeobius salinus]|uniref:M14 family zinc carboxypeptidase n=1 Tax=Haloarchaeobius salinus TaxID=1198298 RepID=UPI0034A2C653